MTRSLSVGSSELAKITVASQSLLNAPQERCFALKSYSRMNDERGSHELRSSTAVDGIGRRVILKCN